MSHFENARDAIGQLQYSGANREVAGMWLSLWADDLPPTWETLTADPRLEHKRAMVLCRIIKRRALSCAWAGSYLPMMFGFDITGKDLLSLLPENMRADRLTWSWQIVEGALTAQYRLFKSSDGAVEVQGISLPLSGVAKDGSRFFLMHTNWRPQANSVLDVPVRVQLENAQREMIKYI